jgi:phosphoglycerate dehydrogenase-like enzyme
LRYHLVESFEYEGLPRALVRKRMLVAGNYPKRKFADLDLYAEIYWLDELDNEGLEALLPSIDGLFVNFWPKELGPEKLQRMSQLAFVQSGLAGVNQIPFRDLNESVAVSSNAGGTR